METTSSPTENLIAVPSLDPAPDSPLPFDLFVRLPVSDRVILYRRQGSTLDQAQIDKAQSGRMNFFVQRDDYKRYLEYISDEFFTLVLARPADKARMRTAAGRVLSNALSQDNAENAKVLLDNLGDVMSHLVHQIANEGMDDRRSLFDKFAKLAEAGTDFQRHPLHVASLTVMLSIGLGIHDQRTLVEIALAGLLHDIGLTQLPMSVIDEAHRYKEQGTVSKALLKLHPQGTLDLLWNRGIQVSRLMENMIIQHHEEFGGGGYPHGLTGAALHPLAQVLHVADDLDELIGLAPSAGKVEEKVTALFRRYEAENVIEPSLRKAMLAILQPKI